MREQFFRQVNHLCLRFHIKRSSGELFSYLFGSPLAQIVQFYQHCSMNIAGAIITVFSAVMITLGQVTGVMLAYSQLQGPLSSISQAFMLFGGAQTSIERIGEVMRAASTTPDPVGGELDVPPAGDLELRGVHFAYEQKKVLNGIDIRIPYGQRVALVGPSGSGKSTIAMLLLRMYDPDHGSVRLGGVDLRHCIGAEVRRRFGVVPQDPFIFRTTLRQNLKVARPEADDALLERACKQANAWEFIRQLPQGLDTKLGEGGANLSGGQRQRLSIARAILADAPFLLFDEATSALDTLSEQLVQQTIGKICAGRTAIIIAHRLATVKDCDRILVVQDGRIAQDGTYTELAGQPGLFRDLVAGQQLLA